MSRRLGIIHPGAMGISVAATAQNSGMEVCWASRGRSSSSRQRAEAQQLRDAGTVAELCRLCDTLVSVCPPHAAEEVAEEAVAAKFAGLYLDANAISPQRSRRIGGKLEAGGASYVDGGIIGGPAWEPGRTWLYLSGSRAKEAAACFAAGPLEISIVSQSAGDASALKACFAAYTKGTTALLCGILALAEEMGVCEPLFTQWSRGGSDFADKSRDRVRHVTAKAWRFAGEMEEIADTFAAANLPAGFHQAANDIYRRLAHFKDAAETPALEEVLAALRTGSPADE